MDIQWLLTYFGAGYLLATGMFGPAVFTAVINDLVRSGKLSKILSAPLLLLQAAFSLVAIVFVVSFVVREGKALEFAELYKWVMVGTFFATMGFVFLCLAYLNKLFRAK